MAEKQKGIGKTVLGWFVVQEGEEAQGAQSALEDQGAAPPKAVPAGDPNVDDLIARYAGGTGAGSKAPPRPAQAAPAAQKTAPVPGPAAPAPKPAGGAPAGVPVAVTTGQTTDKTLSGEAARGRDVAPAQLDFADVFKKQGLSPEQQAHVERTLTLLNNLPKETPREVKRQIVEASLIAFGIPVDRIIESAALHTRALDRHTEKGQQQTQALLAESTQRLKALEQEAARIKQIMQEQLDGQQGLALACNQQKARIQEVLDFFGKEAVDRVISSSIKLRDA